jgi:hypothetical protein
MHVCPLTFYRQLRSAAVRFDGSQLAVCTADLRYTSSEKERVLKPNKYGVVIKTRAAKQRPVPRDLSGEQGTRLVLTTAKSRTSPIW